MNNHNWFEGIRRCQNNGIGYVLITVMGSLGSTPRPQGTKMVVTAGQIFGSIGGGNLEHQAIQSARSMLTDNSNGQRLEHFPLAAKLSQCCGGATHVLFESFVEHINRIAIFGAGHVSQALIPILAQLPLHIDWFDSRAEMFNDASKFENVTQHIIDSPKDVFTNATNAKWALIMTHDHQLDMQITEQALATDDIEYVGLIGSKTKAKRFKYRLGINSKTKHNLNKLVSPVGVLDIPGKSPIEVAVSIAGQIIQKLHENAPPSTQQLKQSWQQTKHIADLL